MKLWLEKNFLLVLAVVFLVAAVIFGMSSGTISGGMYSRVKGTDWGMVILAAVFGAGGMYSLFKHSNRNHA